MATEEVKPLTEWPFDGYYEEGYDQFQQDDDWENLTEDLTTLMDQRNPGGWWTCTVNNFGWRKLDGVKTFYADTGRQLLQEILPKTDCSFRVYHDEPKGLKINNAHHDSPVWAEWYYLREATEEELE